MRLDVAVHKAVLVHAQGPGGHRPGQQHALLQRPPPPDGGSGGPRCRTMVTAVDGIPPAALLHVLYTCMMWETWGSLLAPGRIE